MGPGTEYPGVGVGLAVMREGRILLYRRTRPPEAGSWTIVGGKVDHMEQASAAAIREAEEESGLAIGSIRFLCVSEHRFPADGHHWISLIYATDDFSGEPRIMEPEKLPEFGWFELDELPQPLSLFAADAIAAIKS